MTRVLIITSGEFGHLNPVTSVVQQLVQERHDVTLLVRGPAPSEARRRALVGAELIVGEARPPSDPKARVELFADPGKRRSRLMSRLPNAVQTTVELRNTIEKVKPDVVAVDSYVISGALAAHLSGRPWATLRCDPTSNAPLARVRELMADVDEAITFRDELFGHYGVATRADTLGVFSEFCNIVFGPAEYLADECIDIPATHFVGPMLTTEKRGDEPTFPWEKLDSRRLVYISFGSVFSWQPQLFVTLLRAIATLDVQVVVAAGATASSDMWRERPPQVVVERYVPQLDILMRSAAFVTHGGFNSVIESGYSGVPMVVVPLAIDQGVHAHYVSKSGAGITISRDDATVEAFELALRSILKVGSSYQACASVLSDKYRKYNGPLTSAQLLVALAARTS